MDVTPRIAAALDCAIRLGFGIRKLELIWKLDPGNWKLITVMNETNPSQPADRPMLDDQTRKKLEAIPRSDPDDLLKPARGSVIIMALVVSIAAHAVLVGLTSFPLFADWKKYGVHHPTKIDEFKAEEAEKKRLEEQQAKLIEHQRRVAEAAEAADAAPADADGKAPPEKKPAEVKPPDGKTEAPLDDFDLNKSDLGL